MIIKQTGWLYRFYFYLRTPTLCKIGGKWSHDFPDSVCDLLWKLVVFLIAIAMWICLGILLGYILLTIIDFWHTALTCSGKSVSDCDTVLPGTGPIGAGGTGALFGAIILTTSYYSRQLYKYVSKQPNFCIPIKVDRSRPQ